MVDYQYLLDYCQIEALANAVRPTESSSFRAICRSYSKLFPTPLHLVLNLDPEFVILNVYEHQAESLDLKNYQRLEDLLDRLSSIDDPNHESKKKKEQEEFDRKAEAEEAERIKAGRPVHQPKKTLLKKEEKPEEKRPTQGSINLDLLAQMQNEG